MIILLLGVLGFSAGTISFYQAWAQAKRPATLHNYLTAASAKLASPRTPGPTA